jgi:hypothetical protein
MNCMVDDKCNIISSTKKERGLSLVSSGFNIIWLTKSRLRIQKNGKILRRLLT